MKKQLLTLTFLIVGFFCFGQAPQIEGDIMLCPWDNGTATITSGQTYDSYQWYYKYWFLSDDYEAIDGATEASFTYDWYTYDQALLKVVVTSGGNTYESNAIQVDSWNWTSFLVSYQDTDTFTFDPDTFTYQLCEGTSVVLSINNPPYDTNIQWFKDDVPIVGANDPSYTISGAGTYKVRAAPQICPNSTSTSPEFVVEVNTNCQLSVGDKDKNDFRIYPNPANDRIAIKADISTFDQYFIYDMTGKKVAQGALSQADQSISIANLNRGVYLVSLKGENASATHKVVKQ